MRAIDPVADIRRSGDRLKAVQKTRRYVEMTKVGVVEQKRLLPAERGGVPTDIDQDIVNGAVRASDEFGLPEPGAPVHPADDALDRSRLGILNEPRRQSRRFQKGVEDVGVERAGEQTAVVAMGRGRQDENVGKIGVFNAHEGMVP